MMTVKHVYTRELWDPFNKVGIIKFTTIKIEKWSKVPQLSLIINATLMIHVLRKGS